MAVQLPATMYNDVLYGRRTDGQISRPIDQGVVELSTRRITASNELRSQKGTRGRETERGVTEREKEAKTGEETGRRCRRK